MLMCGLLVEVLLQPFKQGSGGEVQACGTAGLLDRWTMHTLLRSYLSLFFLCVSASRSDRGRPRDSLIAPSLCLGEMRGPVQSGHAGPGRSRVIKSSVPVHPGVGEGWIRTDAGAARIRLCRASPCAMHVSRCHSGIGRLSRNR